MSNDSSFDMRGVIGIIAVIVVIGVVGMIFMMMSDTMLGVAEKVSSPSDNIHPLNVNSSENYTDGVPTYVVLTQAAYPGLFSDIQNNQKNFRMVTGTSGKASYVIPHYTEKVDGSDFKVWVKVPDISTLNDTVISVNPLHYSTYDHSSASTFGVFDPGAESIYHFSGNLQDTMGNYHGVAVDGAATSSAAGRYGNYLSLNGTSQASSLGDLGTTYVNGVTVAAWVNTTDNGGYPSILSSIGYDAGVNFTTTSAGWDKYDMTTVDAGLKGYIGAAFDGRYVYFVPNNNGASFGKVARYDTTADFSVAGSWSRFDMTTVDADLKGYPGAAFDGRYVYFVPYNNGASFGKVARYDTTADFSVAGSWSRFDMTTVDADLKGYHGAAFDGRYVYFVPNYNGASFGKVARYDTTADFSVAGSWSRFDMTTVDADLKGYIGAAFDGRYVYFVPNNNGASFGKVARYDTSQDIGLGLSGAMASNSYGAAPLAPTFAVGIAPTSGGLRMVSAPNNLTPNTWTHIAGTYDGQTVSLYVNGALAASRTYATVVPAIQSTADTYIGGSYNGTTWFSGGIDEVVIVPKALTAAEIKVLGTSPNYLEQLTLHDGTYQVTLQYNALNDVVVEPRDPTLEHGADAGATYEQTEKYLMDLTDLTGMSAGIVIIVMVAGLIFAGLFVFMKRDD